MGRQSPSFIAGQATTQVFAQPGVADRVGRYAATYGTRALIVIGERHARESGLLDRIIASLAAEGISHELIEGVGPNPSCATVDAGAMLARACRAELIVAVGGGSVIDAAKAIATAAAAAQPRPFVQHLSGIRSESLLVDTVLPVVAVPTLLGSGSETNGTSVITDDASGRKLSAHSDLAAPRLALLDPLLVLGAPRDLVAPGLVDALCHAIEAGCADRSTIASDALSEQALRTLVRLGASPLDATPEHPRLLLEAWWATNLAGQALTLAGSIVTHPLAHPLSARLDIRHGEAVAALEPAVLVTFADRLAASGGLTRVAHWLDVRGASDADTALRGVVNRYSSYCRALDVTASASDLGLEAEHFHRVVADARASGSRGLHNIAGVDEPSNTELRAVLTLACLHGPAAGARKFCDAREETTTPSNAHSTGS